MNGLSLNEGKKYVTAVIGLTEAQNNRYYKLLVILWTIQRKYTP